MKRIIFIGIVLVLIIIGLGSLVLNYGLGGSEGRIQESFEITEGQVVLVHTDSDWLASPASVEVPAHPISRSQAVAWVGSLPEGTEFLDLRYSADTPQAFIDYFQDACREAEIIFTPIPND